MENIYIEGIQGMGKSTLLSEIARRRPEYRVCREGDYSPVDLAWCAWMDGEQYASVLERYAPLRREIEEEACREGERYIVAYTKILTDIPGFHKDLEQYEIYNGRKTPEDGTHHQWRSFDEAWPLRTNPERPCCISGP